MANETNESRRSQPLSGPHALAACLLEVLETLYSRHLALVEHLEKTATDEAEQQYWRLVHDDLTAEYEERRNEWRPQLERMIRRVRNKE